MLEIFQYEFMQRAFLAGLIVSVIAPLVGMFLVVRKYSFMADTLAHISLAGVALGFFVGVNPLLSSILVAIFSSFGMEKLREKKIIFDESVLAIFLSGSLALAVVLISVLDGLKVNLFSFLFGSITTIAKNDLLTVSLLGLFVFISVLLFYRGFFVVAVDEDVARARGVKVVFLNMLLIFLSAIAVSISMRIVGALLVGALMVIPVLASLQFRLSFKKTLFVSIVFSVLATIAGLFVSYFFDAPSGGVIVLLILFIFILSVFFGKK